MFAPRHWFWGLLTLGVTATWIAALAAPGPATVQAQDLPAQAANIVVNGDFESPAVAALFNTYAAGASVGGWSVSRHSVDLVGSEWVAAKGQQSVDLNGLAIGSLFQNLPTTPGQSYVLRFALAGNPGGPSGIKTVHVDLGGTADTLTFDATGRSAADMGWTYHEIPITADGSVVRLAFTSLTVGVHGPVLDDVSVIPQGKWE
jgi:choice-of-anchor C domain-containing protein